MAKERLGEILIRAGLLQEAGLREALAAQQRLGGHLGRHLVALGLITEETLVRALSTQCKLPAVALDPVRIDPRVGRLLPQAMCERNSLVCFGFDERRRCVDIAMADPSSVEVIEEVGTLTRCSVRRYFAAPSAIEGAISLIFHGPSEASGEIDLPPSPPVGPAGVAKVGSAPTQQALGGDVPSEAERRPGRLAQAVAPPALRQGGQAPRRPSRPTSSSPPPPPRATPPPTPVAASSRAPALDSVDEIPLPAPSHVHITLDLPTIQKMRHKETAEQRLNRVEDMLARDGKLLQLLLGILVRKGLLTREEIDRIFSHL